MVSVVGWYASVDYLRVTAPQSENAIYPRWRKIARLAASECDDYAQELENTRIMQYYGSSFGSAFAGISDAQGIMMQASGMAAHSMALRYADYAYSIPRLDLQVTVWFDCDLPNLAEDTANTHMSRRKPIEKQPLPSLRKEYGKGDTFYAGSRGGTGSSYIRLYDKYRESGNEVYRNSWRYEVELTNRRALPAFEALRRCNFSSDEIAAQVSAHCASRYIDLPQLEGVAMVDEGVLPRPLTTDDSRIRWLQRQVSPAIDGLLKRGYRLEYLASIVFGGDNSQKLKGGSDG